MSKTVLVHVMNTILMSMSWKAISPFSACKLQWIIILIKEMARAALTESRCQWVLEEIKSCEDRQPWQDNRPSVESQSPTANQAPSDFHRGTGEASQHPRRIPSRFLMYGIVCLQLPFGRTPCPWGPILNSVRQLRCAGEEWYERWWRSSGCTAS